MLATSPGNIPRPRAFDTTNSSATPTLPGFIVSPTGTGTHGADFNGEEFAAIFYAAFFTLWSLAILVGLYFVYKQRLTTAVKIRDWRLITFGVVAIHHFMAVCFIAPWVGPDFDCTARFWSVSLALPLCVAGFQMVNVRLPSYCNRNRASGELFVPESKSWLSLHNFWKSRTFAQRGYLLFVVCIAIQLAVTVLLFFGSRKFHGHYGIWGNASTPESCSAGFEWVVSFGWLALWTLASSILIIRKTIGIQDVYLWGCQTRVISLCSILGMPVWIVFMFLPSVNTIKQYAPPAVWYIPGLAIVQVALIGFPLWGAYKVDAAEQKAVVPANTIVAEEKSSKEDMKVMLDAIKTHYEPLADWASRKRFNAELVAFIHLADSWKSFWLKYNINWESPDDVENRVTCYKHAALIYFKLIALGAEFPINISDTTRRPLGRVFGSAFHNTKKHDSAESQSITSARLTSPWEFMDSLSSRNSVHRATDVGDTLSEALNEIDITNVRDSTSQADKHVSGSFSKYMHVALDNHVDAPRSFDLEVFDQALREVQLETYHNIWLPLRRCSRDFEKMFQVPCDA